MMPDPIRLPQRQHLTRPELSQLTHLVHTWLASRKPHVNESLDMFEFRMKPWRDLLRKLQDMFEEEGR